MEGFKAKQYHFVIYKVIEGGVRFCGYVKLCVFSIMVKMDSKMAEKVTKGKDL